MEQVTSVPRNGGEKTNKKKPKKHSEGDAHVFSRALEGHWTALSLEFYLTEICNRRYETTTKTREPAASMRKKNKRETTNGTDPETVHEFGWISPQNNIASPSKQEKKIEPI